MAKKVTKKEKTKDIPKSSKKFAARLKKMYKHAVKINDMEDIEDPEQKKYQKAVEAFHNAYISIEA